MLLADGGAFGDESELAGGVGASLTHARCAFLRVVFTRSSLPPLLALQYTMFMVKGDRTPPITIAVRSVVNAVKDCLDKTMDEEAIAVQ